MRKFLVAAAAIAATTMGVAAPADAATFEPPVVECTNTQKVVGIKWGTWLKYRYVYEVTRTCTVNGETAYSYGWRYRGPWTAYSWS